MNYRTLCAIVILIGISTMGCGSSSDRGSPAGTPRVDGDAGACANQPIPAVACEAGDATAVCTTPPGEAPRWDVGCRPRPASFTGTWGGENAKVVVADGRVSFEFNCAGGQSGGINLAADGSFRLEGTYFSESGGPSVAGEPPPASLPAVYKGTITGQTMTFTIEINGASLPEGGPYVVVLGAAPKLDKCV
jgi:hypothetical protein